MRKRLLPFGVAFAFLGALSLSAVRPAQEGRKWALVVGIDHYDSEDISELRFAVADAKAFAEALVTTLGFASEHVITLPGDAVPGNANRPTDVNVIKRLDYLAGKIHPEDTFVFYFSGHGYQREAGHFLATINADTTSIETLQRSTLPLDLLKAKIGKIQAHRMVFIIDACRNDPERGKGAGDNRLTEGFAKDMMVVAKSAASAIAGNAVLFACSAGERAYEWEEKGHGVFSYYLLEGIKGGVVEPGGEVTMTALGDYIQKQVADWAAQRGKQQRPDLHQEGAARVALGCFTGKGPAGAEAPMPAGGYVGMAARDGREGVLVLQTWWNGPADDAGIKPGDAIAAFEHKAVNTVSQLDEMVRATPPGTRVELGVVRQGQPGALLLTVGTSPGVPTGNTWVSPADGAEMVLVPAGEFIMGAVNDEGAAAAPAPGGGGSVARRRPPKLFLPAFYVDKYEVTNDQYARFLNAKGERVQKTVGWAKDSREHCYYLDLERDPQLERVGDHWQPKPGFGKYPVVNVTWYGAAAYACWAGKRLLTEAEWEKAARGTDGRQYPWGNEWDPARFNAWKLSADYAPAPIGSYPGDVSPYGCMDLGGNATEWTCTLVDGGTLIPRDSRYSADVIVKGGGRVYWRNKAERTKYEGEHYPTLGFRCARDAEPDGHVAPNSPGSASSRSQSGQQGQ